VRDFHFIAHNDLGHPAAVVLREVKDDLRKIKLRPPELLVVSPRKMFPRGHQGSGNTCCVDYGRSFLSRNACHEKGLKQKLVVEIHNRGLHLQTVGDFSSCSAAAQTRAKLPSRPVGDASAREDEELLDEKARLLPGLELFWNFMSWHMGFRAPVLEGGEHPKMGEI